MFLTEGHTGSSGLRVFQEKLLCLTSFQNWTGMKNSRRTKVTWLQNQSACLGDFL